MFAWVLFAWVVIDFSVMCQTHADFYLLLSLNVEKKKNNP